MKNLHDLKCHSFPYNVPIIPHPLPSNIVDGEHFVTTDLLSLIPGSSSPYREEKSEAVDQELVIGTQPSQSSSTSEDSGPAPRRPGGSRGIAVWSVLPWQ